MQAAWGTSKKSLVSDLFLRACEASCRYGVNQYIIKPRTADRQCSYVELVAPEGAVQTPKWFVSHWSGRLA